MAVDEIYAGILKNILTYGGLVNTRNSWVIRYLRQAPVFFDSVPLVTARKTAWKKALREMEWFLSGDPVCPPEFAKSWWGGQLSPDGKYKYGYPEQFMGCGGIGIDQIHHAIESLIDHPNSRRTIITTWDADAMACITDINENPHTPTTCHGTILQLFVEDGKLCAKHYQRSADILLGVPHNWIQYWALLLYIANRAGLDGVGWLRWDFGDLHLYDESSHREAASEIVSAIPVLGDTEPLEMRYEPTSADFVAADFSILGDVLYPVTDIKPKLIA